MASCAATIWLDLSSVADITRYVEHLRKRAAGEVMTTAAWLRQFVTTHPGYKKDSVVTDEIAYDLVVACQEIGLVSRWGDECAETNILNCFVCVLRKVSVCDDCQGWRARLQLVVPVTTRERKRKEACSLFETKSRFFFFLHDISGKSRACLETRRDTNVSHRT